MKEYLLLFTIGPVQSFIGNSRKMRDLYAGSFLLSHLILHICTMVDDFQSDMQIERIIPVVTSDETASAPNRILLKVSFSDDQCLKGESFIFQRLDELAKYMESEVHSEFKRLYETVFRNCGITPNSSVLAQLENFPEVYWAYQGYKRSGTDFEKITSKLQAVKSLRPFSQTAENAGRKCSLFSEYNALFYRSKDGKKPKYMDSSAIEFTGEEEQFYALKPGEGLSAIAFVKRMLYYISDEEFQKYQYNKDIISVASMLLNSRFANDLEGQALLKELSLEAAESVFDRQNGLDISEEGYKLKDIQAADVLFQYMKKKEISISPYYAVVKFDGDGMGDLYRKCSAKQQTKLSEEIGRFAGLVPNIMKDYHGICIYAGGEDFLGFFPSAKAVPALIELRQKFQATVKHPLESAKKLTFSAGVVIAHLMPPLKNVLALADKMEQLAKSNPDKDSFAIAVSKRSGTETHVCSRFGEDSANLKALCKISERIRQNLLSVSSVYALLSVLEELPKNGENLEEDMLKPIIISSICPPAGKKEKDEQNADKIFALYKQYNRNIQDFTAALEITVFFGKEEMSCITE